MKRSAVLSVLILGLLGALAAVPAYADSTLYTNGPSSYSIAGKPISSGWFLMDSFTISQNSTVTSMNFVVWLNPGDTLSSVDWLIMTSPFGGTNEGSGTTSTTNSFIGIDGMYDYFDIYKESSSIPDLSLDAGTYWLQFQNAAATNGHIVYWDENDGPSSAYLDNYAIGSESFQILGYEESPVPEPSSFLLLGSGLAGLAGLIKRKLMA